MPHYYSLHQLEEERFDELVKCLTKERHPDLENMVRHAREQMRVKQQNDARCALGLKTVQVYRNEKLLAKLSNVKVGDSTATVCFSLLERNADGAIHRSVEVTGDMQIFVEDGVYG